MAVRTDLALERLEGIGREFSGVKKTEENKNGMLLVRVEINTDEAAKLIKKPKGIYITAHLDDMRNASVNILEQARVIADEIRTLLPKKNCSALIVGLGNSDITPDALGPRAVTYSFATRHIGESLQAEIGIEGIASVCAVAPGVLGQTGVESAELVHALVQKLKPDVVIAIDALASKSVDRLGSTMQIANTGISPGSGVQNRRQELSMNTLGVPVISVGVPMVVDMATIAQELYGEDEPPENSPQAQMMVTPREVDLLVEHAAKLSAYAVNHALQSSLSLEDLVSLVG